MNFQEISSLSGVTTGRKLRNRDKSCPAHCAGPLVDLAFAPESRSGFMKRVLLCGLTLTALLLVWTAFAGQIKSDPTQSNETARKAYAILEAHCAKCHGKANAPNLNLFNFHD